MSTAFKILVSLRMSAGIWSPLTDCDEVYNYWEPLHMLLYGRGFQTWEYSPVYAIRSYAYLWLHGLPLKLFQLILPHTKVTSFFFLRCFLGFCSALAEAYLYRAVCRRLGNGIGRLYAIFTALGAGMFISSSAFLPSSFGMILTTLSLALWLENRQFLSVLAVAVSALVGWPFAAALGLHIVLELLVLQRKWKSFLWYALASGAGVSGILAAVDSHYFGRTVLPPLNIVLYNVFSGRGPNLYGTAPASFYLLNLLLNWNFVAVLAAGAIPAAYAIYLLYGLRPLSRLAPVALIQANLFLWLLVFFCQPHKEERFLYPIYPLLCLSAAVTLDAAQKILELIPVNNKLDLGAFFATAIVTLFMLLSGSRSVALYKNYHAPFDAYMALNERLSSEPIGPLVPSELNVCVGKEWYRFPSNFFLPTHLPGTKNLTKVGLKFVKSEFKGLLPKPYEDSLPVPEATRKIPTEMNDLNREEPSRYIPVETCHYLVDLDTPDTTDLEPNYSLDAGRWSTIHEGQFLIAARSHRLYRAFYVPGLSERHCFFGRYVVLERVELVTRE